MARFEIITQPAAGQDTRVCRLRGGGEDQSGLHQVAFVALEANETSACILAAAATDRQAMVATRRGEQSTLYSLRFGMQRAKRGRGRATGSDAADEAKHDAKRPRLSGDEQEEQAALDGHAEGSSGRATSSPAAERQFVKGSGTTTDPSALKPVTHKAFLSKYAVSGLDNVYYNRCWVSGPTAHRWRRELDALLEWYRPKLKVYGREIQQSRAIAGEYMWRGQRRTFSPDQCAGQPPSFVLARVQHEKRHAQSCFLPGHSAPHHFQPAFSTTPGLELKYSGHDVVMHSPFPPLLEAIAARIAQPDCLGEDVKFNHAMLNRYEDGSVHIGKHSDNRAWEKGEEEEVVVERTVLLTEKRPSPQWRTKSL